MQFATALLHEPALLILDELGYLPIDKTGADLLFQIISLRYEHGATVITSNRVFKHWAQIFNNDATLTSALLDRLLHHAETIVIEGQSYRMKDRIESCALRAVRLHRTTARHFFRHNFTAAVWRQNDAGGNSGDTTG